MPTKATTPDAPLQGKASHLARFISCFKKHDLTRRKAINAALCKDFAHARQWQAQAREQWRQCQQLRRLCETGRAE